MCLNLTHYPDFESEVYLNPTLPQCLKSLVEFQYNNKIFLSRSNLSNLVMSAEEYRNGLMGMPGPMRVGGSAGTSVRWHGQCRLRACTRWAVARGTHANLGMLFMACYLMFKH